MKLYLKIGGEFRLMKLDAASEIALNFTHDNLENPTNYVSENSYSLKLPKCPENNKIFSNFLHLDSVVVSGGYDPTQRMDYVAMSDEGEVVSTGTAVIRTITNKYYDLSLLGTLSRLFYSLINAGWDTEKASEDSTYHLMEDWLKKQRNNPNSAAPLFSNGINTLNAELVYASWTIDNPVFDFPLDRISLRVLYGLISDRHITETNAFIASIIGFAPIAQGRYKNFESNIWIEGGNATTPGVYIFLPVLCDTVDLEGEPVQKTDVQDGTIDVQMGEFRSYYMQPYIYVFRLWQLFQMEFHEITGGYALVLDDRWFNETNDELERLVYTLPQVDLETKKTVKVSEMGYDIATAQLPSASIWGTDPTEMVPGLSDISLVTSINDGVLVQYEMNELAMRVTITLDGLQPGGGLYYFNPYNVLKINVFSDTVGCTVFVYPIPSNGVYSETSIESISTVQAIKRYCQMMGYDILYPVYDATDSGLSVLVDIPLRCVPRDYQSGDTMIVTTNFYNNYVPIRRGSGFYFTENLSIGNETSGTLFVTKNSRSYGVCSLESLFKDISPFSILMQYSKAHHLMWMTDDDEKIVTVKRAVDAYSDMVHAGIIDISMSVDKSKDIAVYPLSWDTHGVVFNMTAIDGDGVDGYEERYGLEYGSKIIYTRSNTNDEKKELLGNSSNDKIMSSVMLSQTIIPARVMRVGARRLYIETPPMPLNVSNGEAVENWGSFYYRHNNVSWDEALLKAWQQEDDGSVYVIITDDSGYIEIMNDRYCWKGEDFKDYTLTIGDGVKCYLRPVINTVSANGLSVLFAAPREQYTYQPDEPTEYMYEHCWKDYIEEVYNQQNKTVELYININNSLLARLRRNPLVQIGNCIYLLMEIKDWTERKQTCKCKLRQIYNLSKLTGQQ